MSIFTAQLQPFSISGAGAVAGATSVTLKSFLAIDGTPLTMADFGAIGFGTLEPGNSVLEEQVSFTGVTKNANGTGTLTGVKSVEFLTPYTSTSGLSKTHAGSTEFVISNTSGMYDQFGAKQNDEEITGFWEAPDPVTPQGIATRQFVLNAISGTAVFTTAAVVVPGTAGEALSAGNGVYLNSSDGRWYLWSSASAATTDLLQLGIAQGTGTTGMAIASGVLLKGLDQNQTGLVTGSIYYLSTAGGISSSAGTVERAVGNARSSTSLYFDPDYFYVPTANQKAALAGASGTAPSTTNRFLDRQFLVGTIQDYAGSSAPSWALDCDGTAVSRTTYSALFTAIGTAWGAGNGTSTFNLPDLRGRATIGVGTGTKVFTFASRSSNTITVTGSSNSSTNEVQTGQAVLYSAPSGVITGLTDNTTYYIIRVAYNQFQLATSVANAVAGTAIALSSDGTGTQTFTVTLSARILAETGGEETHAITTAELAAHVHAGVYDPDPGAVGGATPSLKATNTDNSTASTGGSTAHDNMMPFGAVRKVIIF